MRKQRTAIIPVHRLSFSSVLPPLQLIRQEVVLTRIHPLHAIWKGIVRNQIISSPSRICYNSMSLHQSHSRHTKYNQTRELHCDFRLPSSYQPSKKSFLNGASTCVTSITSIAYLYVAMGYLQKESMEKD